MSKVEKAEPYPCQHEDAWRAFYPCSGCPVADKCTGHLFGEWRGGLTTDLAAQISRAIDEMNAVEWSEPGE